MTEIASPALDRVRASEQMALAGLDALLVQSPEHVYYATGYRPWVQNLYRRAGFGGTVVPADPDAAAGTTITDIESDHFRRAVGSHVPLVRTFPFWTAYGDVDPAAATRDVFAALDAASGAKAPELAGQVDREAATAALIALVRDMDLERPGVRIGIEWSFTSLDVLNWLRVALPEVTWIDGTPVLAELRMIKTQREIDTLRAATALAETGIRGALADLHSGLTARDVVHRYQRAVLCDPSADGFDVGVQRLSLRAGPHVLSAEAYATHHLAPGDLLFMDAGVEINGYRSDMGRTAVFGAAPSEAQKRVYDALLSGQHAMRALLRPGTPSSELFWAGQRAVWDRGLRAYVRGNLGHGIGLDPQPELPILSKEDPHVLATGMVISVELPYYIHGLGALQIEDTYLITNSGAEQWTQLPESLLAC